MAKSSQSLVQDKIGDIMTQCSLCAEIFKNPKILPCVHTFCLCCLETYGKDKQPGEQIACPLCRTKLLIPAGGLCSLPNNFFIGKMVEIGKLAVVPANEATCNICPEGEEVIANRYCIDCEQMICQRCSKSHRKIKFSQNHQIVELESRQTAQEQNFRNSYCEHHPKELLKMYCYHDDAAICSTCCVESHQSHRCINVEQAAEEFTKRLKDDLQMVSNKLPECEEAVKKLDIYKNEFLAELLKTEESIRDAGSQMKEFIDRNTDNLIDNVNSVREMKINHFEYTGQEVERFRVMVDSFSTHCEELLSRGSPVDICRTANQIHARADELVNTPANCSGDCFQYHRVVFHPSSAEDILKQCGSYNMVGKISVTEPRDRTIQFESESTAKEELKPISINLQNLKPYQLDLIRTDEFQKMLKQEMPDLEFEVKTTKVILRGMPEVVETAKPFILEKVSAVFHESFEISGSVSKIFVKDDAKIYLTEKFRRKDISASWTCNHQVHVYALNENDLKESAACLKDEVVGKCLHLFVLDQFNFLLQSRECKDLIECLCKEDKLLDVSLNKSFIIVACMKHSFEKTKERIEEFLAKCKIYHINDPRAGPTPIYQWQLADFC